ncbi:hypothetical protein CDL15_Pgr009521 [Punica granatum]|uniref:Protein BIG GRAIN 1-like E n=1 Tax=Punica granatum TaxID=22663 RepID=A0A218WSM2_PUNGR|nr:hypothetical protein CDL15_Pgr009521 [Punica granatum]
MTTGNSDITLKAYPSFHQRKHDSGELDVFEATRYYSGQNESGLGPHGASHPWRTRRMSLDEHVRRSSLFLHQGQLGKQIKNNNNTNDHRHKHEPRQPRSPGGRLASFLNSLFNQSNSKKKKSNKSSSSGSGSVLQSSGKEHEDPDQRRRRRSSISHFRSSSTSSVTESHSKSRTGNVISNDHTNYGNNVHPSVTTPTKSYKDLRSFLDHGQVEASSKPIASTGDKTKIRSGSIGGKSRSELKSLENEEKVICGMEFYRKFKDNKNNNNNNNAGSKESMLVAEEEESDSSSDLFELQIGGGGYCSSDLPVYDTTHIERIKTGAPISINAPS